MARAALPPRVGILVECGPEGLDVLLCRRVCALLRDRHGAAFEEVIVPLDNKRRLLEDCGTVAARLFEDGFDRVIVLWDEEPAWPDLHERLCWSTERGQVLQSMAAAGVDVRQVHPVCIERAIETWLLYDADLLGRVLSRPTRKANVKVPAKPHTLRNAKGVLTRVFRQHGHRYVDVTWATRLAAQLENLNRMRRCSTFKRFAERVMGRSL
jgi:hypothetical protein